MARIAGVGTVTVKGTVDGRFTFEMPSEKDFVRGDVARAVVEARWDLNELRTTAISLEEIFLQLTGDNAGKESEVKKDDSGKKE